MSDIPAPVNRLVGRISSEDTEIFIQELKSELESVKIALVNAEKDAATLENMYDKLKLENTKLENELKERRKLQGIYDARISSSRKENEILMSKVHPPNAEITGQAKENHAKQ